MTFRQKYEYLSKYTPPPSTPFLSKCPSPQKKWEHCDFDDFFCQNYDDITLMIFGVDFLTKILYFHDRFFENIHKNRPGDEGYYNIFRNFEKKLSW